MESSYVVSEIMRRANALGHAVNDTLELVRSLPVKNVSTDIRSELAKVLVSLRTATESMHASQESIEGLFQTFSSSESYLIDFTVVEEFIVHAFTGADIAPASLKSICNELIQTMLESYISIGKASVTRVITSKHYGNGDEVYILEDTQMRLICSAVDLRLSPIPKGFWQWKQLLDLPGYQLGITVLRNDEHPAGHMGTGPARRDHTGTL